MVLACRYGRKEEGRSGSKQKVKACYQQRSALCKWRDSHILTKSGVAIMAVLVELDTGSAMST